MHLYSDRAQSKQLIFYTALFAACILMIMVGIGISSGVSQQTFELVDDLSRYQNSLIAGAEQLRLILALDNIFIACYTATILFLVRHIWCREQSVALGFILAASVMAALLDYMENHHILAMLMSTEQGMPLSQSQIETQMVASALKWHLAYFAFFLLGCLIHARTPFEHVFKWSLIAWQLPVGVAVYPTWGTPVGEALFYLRYGNLLVGFVFFALLCRPVAGMPQEAGKSRDPQAISG